MRFIFSRVAKTGLTSAFILSIFFSLFKTGYCYQTCTRGDIYKDPLNRFEVVIPADKMDIDNWGVAFNDEKNFSNYLVRAYESPPLNRQMPLTIDNVIADIKLMMSSSGYELKVLRQEPTAFKGYEARNFDFFITSEGNVKKFYYTRLIRTDKYVVWLYFSSLSETSAVIVTNENKVTNVTEIANRFFDSVKLLTQTAEEFCRKGEVYSREGRQDEAIQEYNKAIAIDPRLAGAYNGRCICYKEKGDYDKAISDCTKAIEIDSACESAYTNRGLAYDFKGMYKEALSDHNKAIEMNPGNPVFYFNRGTLYGNVDDYEKALSDFNKAIELSPGNPQFHYGRAILYCNMNNYVRSKEDLEKAESLGLKPDSSYSELKKALANKGE